MLKKEEAFYENCLLVKQEGGGRPGFSKRLVQAPSLAPCCKSTRSLFPLLNRKMAIQKGPYGLSFQLAAISSHLSISGHQQPKSDWAVLKPEHQPNLAPQIPAHS